MGRRAGALLAAAAMVILVGGCQTVTGKSLGQNIDDKTITAEVKAKLVADKIRNLTSVDVDTNRGIVYLGGNVSSAETKRDAEQIARRVTGVRGVVNNIQVASAGPAPSRAASSSAPASPSASPATGTTQARHSVTGEVTDVDHAKGRLGVRTDEGDLVLHFPPSAIQNVKQGDRVTVQLGMSPAR